MTPTSLHVSVEDTGVGIKEEDMPKLFEEFRRIEENRNRNIEGTGLGMNITIQLLTLMGSHLNVTSTYGVGSCFSFELEQGIVDEVPIGNLSERIQSQTKEYNYHTIFTAPDADILIVDDNAVNRKVLRGLLKDTLIRIDEADSGEECLNKIEVKSYDLILLDHMMPGMNGIDTLKAIREKTDNPNVSIPIIALTANAVTGAREMYLDNGFDAFLSKPIVFEKLENTLITLLPEEKVKRCTINQDYDYYSVESAKGDSELIAMIEKLPEIDLEYAYLHNGSYDVLYSVIVDYIKMIDSEADKLEDYATYLESKDNLKQYHVKIHSMKTSAAMIGAVHLSGMARMLEIAAVNKDIEAIKNVTPFFLKEWRSYKDKLAPVAKREKKENNNLETIDVNEDILLEQLELLVDATNDMDVDRADAIVSLLKQFTYPEDYRGTMEELFLAVDNLDDNRVMELAANISKVLSVRFL